MVAGVRAVAEQFRDDPDKIKCVVAHEDAGGECERPAVMEVYGLFFCELHGQEAKAGCLEELYDDALQFLELFDAPHVRAMNSEVLRIVRSGLKELPDWPEPDSEEALLRAFPVIPERVLLETSTFNYHDPDSEEYSTETPYDMWRHTRYMIHKLMRLAYEDGEYWLMEVLEEYREQAAAQCAFALVDYKRRCEESRTS